MSGRSPDIVTSWNDVGWLPRHRECQNNGLRNVRKRLPPSSTGFECRSPCASSTESTLGAELLSAFVQFPWAITGFPLSLAHSCSTMFFALSILYFTERYVHHRNLHPPTYYILISHTRGMRFSTSVYITRSKIFSAAISFNPILSTNSSCHIANMIARLW